MLGPFLYGVLAGLLLSSNGRKKVAVKGIRLKNKISRFARERRARLKEDWQDAVIEAEEESAQDEPEPASGSGKPSSS